MIIFNPYEGFSYNKNVKLYPTRTQGYGLGFRGLGVYGACSLG